MKAIKISSSRYPGLLKSIKEPPSLLYYKGNWSRDIFKNCLAVVGSRQMTTYGRRVTNELVSKIAQAGVTIVSGFMYGVDAQAHKAALSVGGRTIAVMPCGIDLIHPEYQDELYEQIIAKRGLVISEIKSDFPPGLWTYPRRNRIVAGLAQATLVVEAGLKSGSLITADLTKRFGRKLFAIPGPLTSSVCQGTLQLIKEGAGMVTNSDDILEVYGLNQAVQVKKSLSNLNQLEQSIVETLAQEPREIDSLSRLVDISASKLGATLSLMQLRGLVSEEKGRYYVNSSGNNS
jgi:DNA processing protein